MLWLSKLLGRSTHRSRWQSTPAFAGLSKAERKYLEQRFQERRVSAGTRVLIEGAPGDELIFVDSGELELIKRDSRTNTERSIGIATAGEILGGHALLDGKPWAMSARSKAGAKLLVLQFKALRERAAEASDSLEKRIYQNLMAGLGASLASRMREQVDLSLQSARKRAVMGQFIVNVLILVCCYVLFLNALPLFWGKVSSTTETFSLPLIVVFGLFSWRFIRKSGYPLSHFGIGFKHLPASVIEAFVLTIPFLLVVTLLKALVVWVTGSDAAVIEHTNVEARLAEPNVALWLRIYSATAVIQELIVRGALQSSLEDFLTGPGRRTRAIFVCALLFSISHLHISYLFSLLAIVPGLFWGWLYSRRRNLSGVSLSHIAVGAYVFFVLGPRLD